MPIWGTDGTVTGPVQPVPYIPFIRYGSQPYCGHFTELQYGSKYGSVICTTFKASTSMRICSIFDLEFRPDSCGADSTAVRDFVRAQNATDRRVCTSIDDCVCLVMLHVLRLGSSSLRT